MIGSRHVIFVDSAKKVVRVNKSLGLVHVSGDNIIEDFEGATTHPFTK